MEDTQEKNKIGNKRTLANDPQYFGAYLNMARHNVFLISKALQDKFENLKIINSDEHISGSFLTDADAFNKINNKNHVFSNLVRFMPLAKTFSYDLLPTAVKEDETIFKGIDYDKMIAFFKLCFTELNAFRNDYSHYYSITTKENRKIKVNADFAVQFRTLFLIAIEFTKNRFKDVFTDKSFEIVKNITLIDQNNTITDRGIVFLACLFLDKENAFHFINRVVGFKDTGTLNFLATREVFSVFCVTLPHEKFISDNPEQALQLDMLNYLSRCPKELFHVMTAEGKKEFQPDLDTIKKLAIEENSIGNSVDFNDYQNYIETISTKKRSTDRFAEFALKYLDANSFSFDFQLHLGKVLKESYKKPLLGEIPEDDNRKLIEDILTFGKLTDFNMKTEDEVIEIQEKMIVEKEFKKRFSPETIDVFTQYAPHYYVENNKIGILSKNYKKYYNQLYRPVVPTAYLSIHELPKVVLLEHLEKGKSQELITNFITANDEIIFNREFVEKIKNELNFEEVLYKSFFDERLTEIDWKSNIDPKIKLTKEELKVLKEKKNPSFQDSKRNEQDVKNKQTQLKSLYYAQYVKQVNERKKKLNVVLRDYTLKANQIPSRILDYWLNLKEVKQETTIKNRIRDEKADCKDRLKAIEKGRIPKIGEMASFLARDIVNLVIDEKVKKKITSFYYDLLQEALALFADPKKKQLFLDICGKELQLFDKKVGHPFLIDINISEIDTTLGFYKLYFELKGTRVAQEKFYNRKKNKFDFKEIEINWMKETFYTVTKNPETGKMETKVEMPTNKPIPYSFKKLLHEKTDFETWFTNVKKGNKNGTKEKPQNPNPKAIDLPTNLFDAALVTLLKEKVGIDVNDAHKYNFSKLLSMWLNDTQPFYNNDREYIIYKGKEYETTVPIRMGEKKNFKAYYAPFISAVHQKKKKADSPQLQVKQVNSVFNKAISENEKVIRFYQMKDRIMLLMLKDLIGTDLEFKLAEISPASASSPLEKQIPVAQKVLSKTITASRKRKDYSLFKRFTADRRLDALFDYYEEENIPYETLRKEIYDYEREREKIFDVVFELEKAIINVISTDDLLILEKGTTIKEPNIQHTRYLDWMKWYTIINNQEFEFLHNIRNKFSHNQFPTKSIIEKSLNLDDEIGFSKQIASYYIAKVQKIIEDKLTI